MTFPPGRADPYILRAGEGRCHLVAGQMIRTLAGISETAGGFGAVVCEAPLDAGPIPLHYHEKEHDTWFCTRGKLQVWCGEESRVLRPGDFAYVAPGDVHSYRSIAPRTQFFGIVAPGGWEEFFADAGEVWGMAGLPPPGRPFDFSRMGPAMAKHRIMRVEGRYAEATPIDERDQRLPTGHASYFLDAGYGTRHTLFGMLSTALLTAEQSNGLADMRVIEGGRSAVLPKISHAASHVFLYLIDGLVMLDLDGQEQPMSGGDAANIPAGTPYSLRIVSGAARWLQATANGQAGAMWKTFGEPTEGFSYPLDADIETHLGKIANEHSADTFVFDR